MSTTCTTHSGRGTKACDRPPRPRHEHNMPNNEDIEINAVEWPVVSSNGQREEEKASIKEQDEEQDDTEKRGYEGGNVHKQQKLELVRDRGCYDLHDKTDGESGREPDDDLEPHLHAPSPKRYRVTNAHFRAYVRKCNRRKGK